MQVNFLMLAEAVIVSREGKLSIIGIFNSWHPQSLPFVVGRLEVVIGLHFNREDAGKEVELNLQLNDPNGNAIRETVFKIGVPSPVPDPPELQVSIPLEVVTFHSYGVHRLYLRADGEIAKDVSATVSEQPLPHA